MIKINLSNNSDILKIFLYLVAIHSFCVGIGLIVAPAEMFEYLGYNKCTERFFPTQGGIFHIIMAVGYYMGALRYSKSYDLIVFSIIVKFSATVFLIVYYLAVKSTWLILLSAVTDGLMGIIIYWLLSKSTLQLSDGE